ncbi:MAG: VWA domain-containing protein [Candidatus Brocadiae bacterium]|nr:VWA domain-containing protein [Candidatus Brocadiia bacterium]
MKKWAILGILAMVFAAAVPVSAEGNAAAWEQAKKDFYRDFSQTDLTVRKGALDRIASLNTADAAKFLLAIYSQIKFEADGYEKKKMAQVAELENDLKPLRKAKSGLQAGEAARMAKLEGELKAVNDEMEARKTENKALLDTIASSLAKFTDAAAVAELRTMVIKSHDWTVRYAILTGLLSSRAEGIGSICLEAAKDRDTRVKIVALDGLLTLKVDAAVPLFVNAVEDSEWQVRLCGVAGVEAYKSKDGISAMVRQLAKEDGRLRDDISGALKRLTGMDFGYNAKAWDEWWGKVKDGWNGQPVGGSKPPDGGVASGGPRGGGTTAEPPTFFGLKINSKKIVFVLDVSGSMNDPSEPPKSAQEPPKVVSGGNQPPPEPWEAGMKGTKIEVLKHEFERTVSKLDPKVTFNVIVYGQTHLMWKDKMQNATPGNRADAIDFVKKQAGNGQTNLGDALEEAFKLAGQGLGDKNYAALVDTIYVMSDGAPNAGKYPNPDDIIRKVEEWNKLSKVVINTIGLGNDGNYNPDFMRRLAGMTGGVFVKR